MIDSDLQETIERIKKVHQNFLNKKNESKLDISKIQNVEDLRKAYKIHQLLKDHFKKDEDVSDEQVSLITNRVIKDLVTSEYKQDTRREILKSKHIGSYHAKDVYDMFTKWPWECAISENENVDFEGEYKHLSQYETQDIIKRLLN